MYDIPREDERAKLRRRGFRLVLQVMGRNVGIEAAVARFIVAGRVLLRQIRGFALLLLLLVGCPTAEPPGDDDDATAADVGYPVCANPAPAPGGWTDGLAASGVGFEHFVPEEFLFDEDDFTLPLTFTVAAGVVSADFDQDGAVDLFFPQTVGTNALYWGAGDGTFSLANPGEEGLDGALCSSASAADYDGDGDLDLAVMKLDGMHLLRLDGRTFTDVTADVGMTHGRGTAGTPSWADFDGDGDLDLYEGRHTLAVYSDLDIDPVPDRLWRNDGGTFTDVLSDFPLVAGDGAWLHGVWDDFDGDGDVDLFHVNDFGDADVNSFLWENGGPSGDRWSWTDRIPDSGTGVMQAPMGALVRDLDGDGWMDLWISGIGETVIYRSLGGPWSFVDATLAWAPAMTHVISDISWSVVDIDLDGDGTPGVLIVYGPLPSEPGDPGFDPLQPDRFFVGDPTSGYVDRGSEVFPSVQDSDSRGVGVSDLNADGVPDLVIGHVNAAPSILLGRCTANNRLVVDLDDSSSSNRHGIGARVTVEGVGTQVQTMRAGGRGTYSGSDPVLFFGMGAAASATVTVRWPDGAEQVVPDACTHCRLTVTKE